ncbi:MAG: c-type cytochrome [Gemmatimonadota bacterium]|nr:c-type cytochrome [Gemmatimonadota bacterium]
MPPSRLAALLAFLSLPLVAAQSGSEKQRPAPQMVRHPDHVQPFATPQTVGAVLANPLEGDANAVKAGGVLFVSYNCMDCHGADGAGAMGPSLADGRWHFGGTPGEIFESIYEGRPDGMPAWGGKISDTDIWRLVTYLRSLEIGKNPSTENFTGKEVERTGH